MDTLTAPRLLDHPQRTTALNMVRGLCAALYARDVHSIYLSTDRFDEALYAAYQCFFDLAPLHQLDVRFRAAPNLYGRSEVLLTALTSAVGLGFARLQGTDLVINRPLRLLEHPQLYGRVADAFIGTYNRSAAV